MSDYIHARPTPQPEGSHPLVVYLIDGSILPSEGKRIAVDRHVRMLLRDGDIQAYEPPTEASAPDSTPTKKHRAARAEEPTE